ncbi:MAG: class I SAM-dependent methyltransferase [Pseudomonadota bacterium]
MGTDTFDRSCAHWSEDGRDEMEQFYEIASVDYRYLAEAKDWSGWLSHEAEKAGARRLRILDVACGSGKFPTALRRYANVDAAGLRDIEYALLDPSRFSIDEARSALGPPFRPGDEFETTLQGLQCDKGAYDIVWATHALYAVPANELVPALEKFINAIGSIGFIAHARSSAHYLNFQKLYLDALDRDSEAPYSSAEDLVSALTQLGASFDVDDISYTNGVPLDARGTVEGYLQRCVFDSELSLDEMERLPGISDYLRTCRTDDAWQFQQHVAMITIRP